eukprot:6114629-Prymnesium_polylepis.1
MQPARCHPCGRMKPARCHACGLMQPARCHPCGGTRLTGGAASTLDARRAGRRNDDPVRASSGNLGAGPAARRGY